MIQRIQSTYLLVVSLCYFLYWFFGKEWYVKGYDEFSKKMLLDNDFKQILLDFTNFIPLFLAILSFITIFLFKYQSKQISICSLMLYVSLIMSFYSAFYFSYVFASLFESMPSNFFKVLLIASIINPFLCSLFIFLAKKSILIDIDLIKSVDRIR